MTRNSEALFRVDFSLRREVFFVVIGAVLGAVTWVVTISFLYTGMGLPYYLTWIAFGHVIGVYSPSSSSIIAGIAIHMITAISIGIAVGVFLYKTAILNISKLSNGLLYGLLAGSIVFIVFFLPVYESILAPEIARTLSAMEHKIPQGVHPEYAAQQTANRQQPANNLSVIMIGWIIIHLVFGVTLGLVSSLLSIKFGSRYRCSKCDISFSRIVSYQKHVELVHGAKPIPLKRVLILGGGFAGIEVLRLLQKTYQDDVSVDITLVSRDNFFLFTPMLPEVSSGMIETRHIVTPVRTFCKRAKFYEANVESIDLKNKQVVITHPVGKQTDPIGWRSDTLKYDYIVLALGGETNFFGMTEVAKNAFTIKSIGDALALRNHIINMLEQADVEHEDQELKKSLMTFVMVGGGFSGVETVGELNDFVRESIKHFYHNIENNDARVILVNSAGRILPEVTEDLAEFALQKLRKSGVEVILDTRLVEATAKRVKLNNGTIIACNTLIWAGGILPEPLIGNLPCEHDDAGRIMANNYLEIKGDNYGAFAVGDCACITDPNTGKPYPPTAQHALRQARVAAKNVISTINGGSSVPDKIAFDYKTKGVMALIGKRNGVGILFGHKVHGFTAWWLWRSYYLGNLPTLEKKLRVMADWVIDLFFKRDVTRVKTVTEERFMEASAKHTEILR
ncbi:MAG: NAD(P)/FAD-dependent oxidoreductase [Thermoproteota archaeon]|nr:NAD(P)/FAD-dependent oxidoreductase [Thermoproteota archaeon]